MGDVLAVVLLRAGTTWAAADRWLTHCLSIGITDIAIVPHQTSSSLMRSLERIWLQGAAGSAIEIWPECTQRRGDAHYMGTADALRQNRHRIKWRNAENVLVIAADAIDNGLEIDIAAVLTEHATGLADVTIACVERSLEPSLGFGIVEIDSDKRLTSYREGGTWRDGTRGDPVLAHVGVYLFDTDYLLSCLVLDRGEDSSEHDFAHSIMTRIVSDASIRVCCPSAGHASLQERCDPVHGEPAACARRARA
jgi:glucose-1-phosphate adenylyltransferase